MHHFIIKRHTRDNKTIYVPHKKEEFNKLKTKMESENESKSKNMKNSILTEPEGIKCQTSKEIIVPA